MVFTLQYQVFDEIHRNSELPYNTRFYLIFRRKSKVVPLGFFRKNVFSAKTKKKETLFAFVLLKMQQYGVIFSKIDFQQF